MTLEQKIQKLKSTPPVDFDTIKKWLDKGDILKLAQEHKIEKQTAYHILCGRKKNFDFVNAAADRALQHQALLRKKLELLSDQ